MRSGEIAGELSVLADRTVGSRVAMMICFVNHDGAPQKFSQLLIDDLEARRCPVICLQIPPLLANRIANWEEQQAPGFSESWDTDRRFGRHRPQGIRSIE